MEIWRINETAQRVMEQFTPELKHFQPVRTDWNATKWNVGNRM